MRVVGSVVGDSVTNHRSWRRWGGEQGSATVWAAWCGAALCAVFVVVLGLSEAVAARHRAAAGADMAALAAAGHAPEGKAGACAWAHRVARAQGARVVRCEVRGEIVELVAAARWGPYESRVRARAGPTVSGARTGASGPFRSGEVPGPGLSSGRAAWETGQSTGRGGARAPPCASGAGPPEAGAGRRAAPVSRRAGAVR
ncbi:hypothetical protein E0L36_22430 [Streptomyces sp. AJS327]|uniref:Rv3654c family TadE-like protein n=1 Tax=Streptomyces sp. AJS327 TaxID=2545265 RepID=UPI0015DDFD86|nr:Rv3654c family TadE-like protein [Streptomyces sp. AJS327]MBA0053533.1 hypothetical protein [Streptomyces sp. AJS327]